MHKTILLAFILLAFSACKQSVLNENYQSGTDYRTIAWNDAIKFKIPPQYFVKQIDQESGFNPSALSSAGAQGIAQIMPSTAQSWGVNPWIPEDALSAAADHMHWYYQHYGYDYAKALACYNAGCSTLEWATQNCLNFYWCLPKQTRGYIDAIMY